MPVGVGVEIKRPVPDAVACTVVVGVPSRLEDAPVVVKLFVYRILPQRPSCARVPIEEGLPPILPIHDYSVITKDVVANPRITLGEKKWTDWTDGVGVDGRGQNGTDGRGFSPNFV